MDICGTPYTYGHIHQKKKNTIKVRMGITFLKSQVFINNILYFLIQVPTIHASKKKFQQYTVSFDTNIIKRRVIFLKNIKRRVKQVFF